MAILVRLLCDSLCITVAASGYVERVASAQTSRSISQNGRRTGEIRAVEILGSDHEVGQIRMLTVWDPKPIELHGFRALVFVLIVSNELQSRQQLSRTT